MAALPADLRAVMKPMIKYTDNIGGGVDAEANVTDTVDYLPLLAEFEASGKQQGANSYECNKQKQYEYFVLGNSYTKNNKYYYRSPGRYKNKQFMANYGTSNNETTYPSYALGLAPIFKV
jgi:hypothetical protein